MGFQKKAEDRRRAKLTSSRPACSTDGSRLAPRLCSGHPPSGVEGPERGQAMALLRGAKKRGQRKGFPEGYVILAGVADLEKKRAEALALYREGVTGLEALPRERKWPTANLRLEAKLQLAWLCDGEGKPFLARASSRG